MPLKIHLNLIPVQFDDIVHTQSSLSMSSVGPCAMESVPHPLWTLIFLRHACYAHLTLRLRCRQPFLCIDIHWPQQLIYRFIPLTLYLCCCEFPTLFLTVPSLAFPSLWCRTYACIHPCSLVVCSASHSLSYLPLFITDYTRFNAIFSFVWAPDLLPVDEKVGQRTLSLFPEIWVMLFDMNYLPNAEIWACSTVWTYLPVQKLSHTVEYELI